jgi:hypothetical protein
MDAQMMNQSNTRCVLGVLLLLFASAAAGDEEQWLRYRWSRQAQQVLADVISKELELSGQKPAGVKLPQYDADAPLFARWPTPMIESGGIWVSLDHSRQNGPYDRLVIDSNADGHLSDETGIPAYTTGQNRSLFGPVKVVLEAEDGPVTYHMNFEFSDYNNRPRLFVTSGGWYEGPIMVRGQQTYCRLVDHNVNGMFSDKSLNPNECDRIGIGQQDTLKTGPVGNYLIVDGVLYRPEVARDGAFIKLAAAEDVVYGRVKVPEAISEFAAEGENGLFTIRPDKGTGKLPVGQYRIQSWKIERKDDKGNTWTLAGQRFADKGIFDVNETAVTDLDVGEPIICTLAVQKKEAVYYFRRELKGRLGEEIKLTRNGATPSPPELRIKKEDGTYDRTFSFEYG